MWILFVLSVVILLFAFPRQMSVVLAVAAVVGAVAGAYYYFQQREAVRIESAVAITARHDLQQCPEESPLRVVIDNQSPETVERVDWVFSARRPGYRSELTGGWLKPFRSDESIEPGAEWSGCFPAPTPPEHVVKRKADDPANLEIGIRSHEIHFKNP